MDFSSLSETLQLICNVVLMFFVGFINCEGLFMNSNSGLLPMFKLEVQFVKSVNCAFGQ